MAMTTVGTSAVRRGLREKLTGEADYSADLKLPGMLHGCILRSPHPHAEIQSIDYSQAAALPGVRAIVTPFDVPPGRLAPDMAVLDTRVRFVGDEVLAIAADDPDVARRAMDLVRVEYQPLPFVLDPEQALKPGCVAIHPQGNLANGQALSLERGDVEKGLADAELVLEGESWIPTHSAAPLEPRAALAAWEGDFLTIWKSSRGVHLDRSVLAAALGMPEANIRVVGPYLGGGFGNKDESRLGALTALLARRTNRPVRVEYSREDEFVAGRVRHAARIKTRVGLTRSGSITAIDTAAVLDTGAYLASGPGVARRAGQGALYLYECANVRYTATLAYTNRPVAGSYRALGAPQGHFALETLMDRAAEALGMDPLEFRLKNRVKPEGQPGRRESPADQIIDSQPLEGGIPFSSNGLEECLRRGSDAFDWGSPRSDPPPDPAKKRGRGMSMMIYRGGPGSDSSAEVRADRSGRISLITGLMDVGEGATTVLAQMAAEVLGVACEDIDVVNGDTETTPHAPITAGSAATFSTGTAVIQAAADLRRQILQLGVIGLEAPAERLEIREGFVSVKDDPSRRISLAQVTRRMGPEYLSAKSAITPGSVDYIVNSFGAHFVEVEVDTDTGRVRVVDYVAAHDSGRIINPRAALGQVEGGVFQMLGLALTEELVTDGPTGVTLNGSYLEHKSPTIQDVPEIRVIFTDVADPIGPLGAKALGEVPCAGVAAAIANAVFDAVGIRFQALPLTPDRVLAALASPTDASRGPNAAGG